MWRRGGSECEAGFLYLEMYVIVFGCSTVLVWLMKLYLKGITLDWLLIDLQIIISFNL